MVVLDLFVTTDDAPATSRIDNTSFNQPSHSVKTVPSSLFVANTRASAWTVVPTQWPLTDNLPNQPSDDIFRQSQESLLAGASRKRGSSSPLLFLDNIFSRLCQKLSAFYNGLMASLFPHEPELLDVQLTAFFIAQLPSMIFITLKWIPALVPWLLGMRGSQAGDRGAGNGMRRSLSMTMGMSLAFLKTYINHAKTMTIEECQSRSKAIPFTNALAWIRVHKIMIPARPYRTKAEDMVYECLTDKERDLLGLRKEGRRIYGINCDSDGDNDIITTNCALGQDQSASANNQEDPLRVEWLEYIGPTHPTQDLNENNNYAAVIYFHGGGYYTGSAEEHRLLVGPLVQRLGKNIRILGVNYRLAPQHPFPGALVDGLTAYMWLLEQSVSESFFPGDQSASANINGCFQPNQIILMGDSAGGGLALSMSLMIRDHGSLPQPLSLIGWSPWLDLTHSLPSFKENRHSDCIPYEDFVHPHSPAVDMMFDDKGDWADGTKRRVRQRAQVYCPDSCLRIKYVSPIFETNFKGISNVFITCGSAERFANESVFMAARLEEQHQACRIDIHEDMTHIFQLFRMHPSSKSSLDRTCAYIKEMVNRDQLLTAGGDVIIPISSPSLLSSRHFSGSESLVFSTSTQALFAQGHGIRRVDSSSSICSARSETSAGSSASSASEKKSAAHHRLGKNEKRTDRNDTASSFSIKHANLKVDVNVIDLTGRSVTGFDQHDRYRLSESSDNKTTFSSTHRHHHHLLLKDVVSKATLHEWEVLLSQGNIPTRHWPFPATRRA